ncbi:MAG: SAM-dependent methyltransferase [Succinivibrio sp.]|nr:SAM-dependent methyltransferase [Succinivibrio sp.]
MPNFYKELNISALDAISEAQKVINGPVLFQAVFCLIEHKVLDVLSKSKDGLTISELCSKTDLNEYALGVLLDMACSGRIMTVSDDGVYKITKIGLFLEKDEMTRINLSFIKHICYDAMGRLDESLKAGTAEGLKLFNESWETVYPHLKDLPPLAKDAWFKWDHLYSQTSFKPALRVIGEKINPKLVYDVGGNTGKFAIECCNELKDTRVKILDLPSQIEMANQNIKEHHLEDRIDFMAVDILLDNKLPGEADVWWLSQFLDCFAKEHVIHILTSIRKVLKENAKICILEPIADRQQFEASAYSINVGSLYFTAVANGYSRFFSTNMLTDLIKESGLEVETIVDGLGISNSMFICKKA